jgi:hypothetical protein
MRISDVLRAKDAQVLTVPSHHHGSRRQRRGARYFSREKGHGNQHPDHQR